MAIVTLEHGDRFRVENPSLGLIRSIMGRAKQEHGPPEFQLEFGDSGKGQPQLWLWVLFDTGASAPEWCVRFVLSKAPSSQYLATAVPKLDVYCSRTRCGCLELFRKECVLGDESVVMEAIEWFVNNGTAKPTLVWLDSGDCVRNA
jgi:hypothetical protein